MPDMMIADAMRLGAGIPCGSEPLAAPLFGGARAQVLGGAIMAVPSAAGHRVGDQVVFSEAAEAVPRRGRVQHMMLPACAGVRAHAQAGSGGGERDGAGGTQPAVTHPKGVPQHAFSITG